MSNAPLRTFNPLAIRQLSDCTPGDALYRTNFRQPGIFMIDYPETETKTTTRTARKILPIEELAEEVNNYKAQGKKVVHCHGVFDLLHIGHIRYFEQARKLGDVLIVTLTPDCYVDKGPHRPAFTEKLRAEAIASLSSVDHVAINRWPTAEETLRLLKPDFYVKGAEFKDTSSDMTGKIAKEEKVASEVGTQLTFTDDIIFSSTQLINEYLTQLPAEIDKFVKLFRERHRLGDILELIERMSFLNVLVIGDTILDEYQYCEAIGKSSKDPTLALKYMSRDLFAGGVLAVANHLASFTDKVQLISVLGEKNRHEGLIRSQLNKNIKTHFLTQPNAPTITKKRFIDGYSLHKLVEVYVMDDTGLPSGRKKELTDWLKERIEGYDLVICADFGHGAIGKEIINLLSQKARFLAVNTQANAGNRGFNTISKYPRADYACIAEHELRLEMRRSLGSVRPMVRATAKKLGCQQFTVTRGRNGCAVYDKNNSFVTVPSFATNVVDRVGAGDTFFAITAMASALGVDNEVLGFLGNIVGALAVQIVGNKKSIDKGSVQKYLVSLLK